MQAQRQIRVMVADDHAVVRRGLRSLLATDPAMELVGEAENGEQAVAMSRTLRPDVILMDLAMPEMAGVEAIQAIKRREPESKVLVLTGQEQLDTRVREALEAGALGVLVKDADPSAILHAIRSALGRAGETIPSIDEISSADREALALLSIREIDILRQLAAGHSNRRIGLELGLKEGTVRSHVSNLLGKLRLKNRTEAALLAIRTGVAVVKPS